MKQKQKERKKAENITKKLKDRYDTWVWGVFRVDTLMRKIYVSRVGETAKRLMEKQSV